MELNFNTLQQRAGIVFATGKAPIELTDKNRMALAMDSALQTSPNAGIPPLFTTFVDPKVIEVLVTPMKTAEAFSECKKGDFTSTTVTFQVLESTGESSS